MPKADTTPIPPDTKDWTWVLSRRCPECGFNAAALDVATVPDLVRENAAAWEVVLAEPGVRSRPAANVWSPLEYACHVRDVYLIFTQRLELMLDQEDPTFPNWDQDATAREEHYNEQDPTAVARQLSSAGAAVAGAFGSVAADQWDRTGRRSDGSVFTVASLARYFIHDPVHHLHDVGGRPGAGQTAAG